MRVLSGLALLLVILLGSLPAQAVEVVASIRPLALIAEAVMRGKGHIEQMVPDGASSHDYALRPSDRLHLAGAGLVFWVGPVHESFLATLLQASPAQQVVMQNLPGITRLPQRDPDNGRALPNSTDPHLWLSPDNAAVAARALAQALAARDPENAVFYHHNADNFAEEMQLAKDRLKARLAPLAEHPYVAYHDAYQYLEKPLGLSYGGSLTTEHEQAPGARHLSELAGQIRREHGDCLLAEPGFNQALAQRVFTGVPARFVSVDELFTQAPRNAQGFEAGLTQMVAGIKTCLGG
jgi:zinc transport system substrate-binding protein